MHFVEVRRWQDIRKKDSVNSDPFNPNLKVRRHCTPTHETCCAFTTLVDSYARCAWAGGSIQEPRRRSSKACRLIACC